VAEYQQERLTNKSDDPVIDREYHSAGCQQELREETARQREAHAEAGRKLASVEAAEEEVRKAGAKAVQSLMAEFQVLRAEAEEARKTTEQQVLAREAEQFMAISNRASEIGSSLEEYGSQLRRAEDDVEACRASVRQAEARLQQSEEAAEELGQRFGEVGRALSGLQSQSREHKQAAGELRASLQASVKALEGSVAELARDAVDAAGGGRESRRPAGGRQPRLASDARVAAQCVCGALSRVVPMTAARNA